MTDRRATESEIDEAVRRLAYEPLRQRGVTGITTILAILFAYLIITS